MKIITVAVKPDARQEACPCFQEVVIEAKSEGGAARLGVSLQKMLNPQERTFLFGFRFFLPFNQNREDSGVSLFLLPFEAGK